MKCFPGNINSYELVTKFSWFWQLRLNIEYIKTQKLFWRWVSCQIWVTIEVYMWNIIYYWQCTVLFQQYFGSHCFGVTLKCQLFYTSPKLIFAPQKYRALRIDVFNLERVIFLAYFFKKFTEEFKSRVYNLSNHNPNTWHVLKTKLLVNHIWY